MRSLVRTRTLTALCVLLLAVASIAHAGVPGRPIDRPGGPPDPDPTMVGDPDAGQEIVTFVFQGRILSFRLPRILSRLHLVPSTGRVRTSALSTRRR